MHAGKTVETESDACREGSGERRVKHAGKTVVPHRSEIYSMYNMNRVCSERSKKKKKQVRFEVLTALDMNSTVFWDVRP
jgi:hypothetical protein